MDTGNRQFLRELWRWFYLPTRDSEPSRRKGLHAPNLGPRNNISQAKFHKQSDTIFQPSFQCSFRWCGQFCSLCCNLKPIILRILIGCWKYLTNKKQGLRVQHRKQNGAHHPKEHHKLNWKTVSDCLWHFVWLIFCMTSSEFLTLIWPYEFKIAKFRPL